jgi:hypothetical protein
MWHIAIALLQAANPSAARMTGAFHSARLRESSGVAISRAHPGTLWTHNDSGDGPFIYASDTTGTDNGALRVPNAGAIDWEDMALGPCPRVPGDCLYLADTGDNTERRPSVTIYAVPEPTPPTGPADTTRVTAPADVLRLRYPGGPSDVEAIYVTRASELHLVTKGRSGGVRLLRVSRAAWGGDTTAVAEQVQQLPIVPDATIGRWVTGAAVRRDDARVAVRTYTELFVFAVEPDGLLRLESKCLLGGLEIQGEAVAFLDTDTMVLTSEAARLPAGTLHIVRCP